MSAPITDLLVHRALALFEREPQRRWTVELLAEQLGVSRATLARRFASSTGDPPMKALTRIRMNRAAELLCSTNHGLACIADAVGYNSEFAFARTFKRYFHIAPGLFRTTANPLRTPNRMAA